MLLPDVTVVVVVDDDRQATRYQGTTFVYDFHFLTRIEKVSYYVIEKKIDLSFQWTYPFWGPLIPRKWFFDNFSLYLCPLPV